MKKKNLLLLLVPVAAMMLTLVGCSDYDNGYTETDFKFINGFKEQFGYIDPQQDWNLASQGTVTVNTAESSEIKVYSESAGTYTLLNTYKRIQGTKVLVFDIVEGMENIVVSDGKTAMRSYVGGSVDFDAQASSAVALDESQETRAHNVNGNLWYLDWVRPTNVAEAERAKVIEAFSHPIKAINTTPVPWENYWVQQVYKGVAKYNAEADNIADSDQMDHLLAYNGNTEEYEHINNFNDGDNQTVYTDDVTKENYYGTTLMVDMGIDMEVMTSRQFGYLNSNDSENHFEYIILEVDGNYYVGFDFYCPLPENQSANHNEAVGRDFIFNDWIVKISPAIPKTVSIAALGEAEEQAWIVASEDLGGDASDIDYNDVVFEVKRINSTRASIKALAAGGTLASYVYYGDKCLGEIHQMFGEGVKESGKYEPINAGGKTASSTEVEFTVSADFTMSYDYTTQGNMGGISIKVLKAGETAYEDPDGSNMTNVPVPQMGGAPYMICLPSPYVFLDDPEVGKKTSHIWAWPLEAHHIKTVYPTFQEWVNDHTKNPTWYMHPANGATNLTGVIEMIKTEWMTTTENEARSSAAFTLNIPDYSATGIKESVLAATQSVFYIPVNSELDLSKYIIRAGDGHITYESASSSDIWNKSGATTDPVMVASNNPKVTNIKIKQEISQEYEAGEVTVTVFTMRETSNLRFNTWGNDNVGGATELNKSLSAGASQTFQVAHDGNGTLTASITNNGSGSTVTTNPDNNTFTVTAGSTKDKTETITVHLAADFENTQNWPEEEITINLTVTEVQKTNPTITFNTGQVNLTVNGTATVNVNSNSQGTFTIQPTFNSDLINASIQNGVITITGKAASTNPTTIVVQQAETDTYNSTTASFPVYVSLNAANLTAWANNSSIKQDETTTINVNTSSNGQITYSCPSKYGTMNGNTFTPAENFTGDAYITVNQAVTSVYDEASATVTVNVTKKTETITGDYGTEMSRPSGISNDNNPAYRIKDIIDAAKGASAIVFTVINSPYNFIEVVGTDANVNWNWSYKISTQANNNHTITGNWPSYTISTTINVETLENMVQNDLEYIVFTCSHSKFFVKPVEASAKRRVIRR